MEAMPGPQTGGTTNEIPDAQILTHQRRASFEHFGPLYPSESNVRSGPASIFLIKLSVLLRYDVLCTREHSMVRSECSI